MRESALRGCVHCGLCLPICPTYSRLGDEADSPRGRLYLIRAVADARITAADLSVAAHLDRCLGCRACETICPSGVEYGTLLHQARAAVAATGGGSRSARLLAALFSRPRLAKVLLLPFLVLLRTGLAPRLARRIPSRFRRAGFALAMLAAARPAAPWAETAASLPAVDERRPGQQVPAEPEPSARASRGRVGMLKGCVQSVLFSHVTAAGARVLEANGFTVVAVRGQACCGAMHAHAGDLETARRLARRNIDAFQRAGVDYVVADAAGCGAALKDYHRLLQDDVDYAERARCFSSRARDLAELLVEEEPLPGAPLRFPVAHDPPCQLQHVQRIPEAVTRLLASVPELDLVPLQGAQECCGGAGIYGLLQPDLSELILRDKLAAIRSVDVAAVLTSNPGCIMQLGAGLILAGDSTPVMHPVEMVDASYRRAGHYR